MISGSDSRTLNPVKSTLTQNRLSPNETSLPFSLRPGGSRFGVMCSSFGLVTAGENIDTSVILA